MVSGSPWVRFAMVVLSLIIVGHWPCHGFGTHSRPIGRCHKLDFITASVNLMGNSMDEEAAVGIWPWRHDPASSSLLRVVFLIVSRDVLPNGTCLDKNHRHKTNL